MNTNRLSKMRNNYVLTFIPIQYYSVLFSTIHYYSLVFISLNQYSLLFIIIHCYSFVFISILQHSLVSLDAGPFCLKKKTIISILQYSLVFISIHYHSFVSLLANLFNCAHSGASCLGHGPLICHTSSISATSGPRFGFVLSNHSYTWKPKAQWTGSRLNERK